MREMQCVSIVLDHEFCLERNFWGIVYAIDATAVWTDLKKQCDKVNCSRIFALHREIGRLTHASNTVLSYYCRLKQMWDEYSS